MVALRATTDAIYSGEYAPDYDWPILPYPAPLSVASIVRKPRKRAPIRIVGMDGAVHTATEETFEQVIADVLPNIEVIENKVAYHMALMKKFLRLYDGQSSEAWRERYMQWAIDHFEIAHEWREKLPAKPDVKLNTTSEPLLCINPADAKAAGLAMPKYTLRVPMRTPLGQRVLVPTCSRYMRASDTFWYRFEIETGCVVWWPEKKLSLVGE